MSYHLEYVDKPEKFDEVVEQEGVKVVIDSKALFSIIGSEMDWQEDALQARFVFKSELRSCFRAGGTRGTHETPFLFSDPNIKDACGCGEYVHSLSLVPNLCLVLTSSLYRSFIV
jgi:iron-sulfur cluster assembly protein